MQHRSTLQAREYNSRLLSVKETLRPRITTARHATVILPVHLARRVQARLLPATDDKHAMYAGASIMDGPANVLETHHTMKQRLLQLARTSSDSHIGLARLLGVHPWLSDRDVGPKE